MQTSAPTLEQLLDPGIRSRMIEGVNGLDMHILEAGFEEDGRPMLLLTHGYPELAFSWRRIMPALAGAGYHVVAPDLRGFGRTTGGNRRFDCDLLEFGFLNKVRDMLALVERLGRRSVAGIIGHDLGSFVTAYCGLVRPDVFRSVVLMSAPFAGPLPLGADRQASGLLQLNEALAALPRPREYYILWNCRPEAAADCDDAPQGLEAFFRAYFHHKSADWPGNKPYRLPAQTAEEMAKMPTYYVMDRGKGMAATVAEHMPDAAAAAACDWLSDDEVAFFAAEYRRSGFQGALNASYRTITEPRIHDEGRTFAGRRIDVPSCFISGAQDWGVYQTAGALDAMPVSGCSRMVGVHLVEGAGHWVQQEQAAKVAELLIGFLKDVEA